MAAAATVALCVCSGDVGGAERAAVLELNMHECVRACRSVCGGICRVQGTLVCDMCALTLVCIVIALVVVIVVVVVVRCAISHVCVDAVDGDKLGAPFYSHTPTYPERNNVCITRV